MKPKDISLQQELNLQINIAFAMNLSAGALVDFIGDNYIYDLDAFEQIIVQLKWIAKQNKNIMANLAPIDESVILPYGRSLISSSERIQSQIETLKITLTKS